MWIVLVGPDGSGKTTLSKRIADRITYLTDRPAEVSHTGPPKSAETAFEENFEKFYSYVPGEDSIVFDRLHFGCPVYGPIYRQDQSIDGYGELGPYQWRYIELAFMAIGAATVLVTADPSELTKRIASRGDDYIDTSDIESICNRYAWLKEQSITALPGSIDPVSMDDADIDRYIDSVIAVAGVREQFTVNAGIYDAYVGSDEPETLMVVRDDTSISAKLTLIELAGNDWQSIGIVEKRKAEQAINVLRPKTISDLTY